MKGQTLSQLRHNKEYLEQMEIKRKGKISIAIGIASIFAGLALYHIATGREGSGLIYCMFGLATMIAAAVTLRPHEE